MAVFAATGSGVFKALHVWIYPWKRFFYFKVVLLWIKEFHVSSAWIPTPQMISISCRN